MSQNTGNNKDNTILAIFNVFLLIFFAGFFCQKVVKQISRIKIYQDIKILVKIIIFLVTKQLYEPLMSVCIYLIMRYFPLAIVYSSPFGSIWLHLALLGLVWDRLVLFISIWSCFVLVWPHSVLLVRLALFSSVWPCLAQFDHIWLHLALMPHLIPFWQVVSWFALFGPIWPCFVPFSLVWPRQALYGPVWPNLALLGQVCPGCHC